ncbi:type VII secretion-associated protein [Mycobacterium europaeum]|uniref:type VII secretion-associated protein n=1 Tax=Mycobacterium europaeum TaxID=761804 RepID=UPI002AE04FCE|nr:type VII secretion-associated protein [Mycobacterium europaeum]MEA1159774.1 type VII secretion-associated protein [Mycobacterium europaeum]
MKAHRGVIEVGPGTIRRLCCGTSEVDDDSPPSEVVRAALGAIDDRVALVAEHPVAVASLWSAVLRSAICADGNGIVVLHPSWWSSSRIRVLSSAAATVSDDVLVRPRSWLLRRAAHARAGSTLVEITGGMVVIDGDHAVAVPRRPPRRPVADEVLATIAGMPATVVLIDTPSAVPGASALAAAIADGAGGIGRTAVRIGGARLTRLARSAASELDEPTGRRDRRDRLPCRARTLGGVGAAAIVLAAAAPAVITVGRHGPPAPRPVKAPPTTFLVEGRVAVTVPADWSTQRVTGGPGSARVQVTSPSDPEVALHVTQSPVAGETLSGAAERLKRAIDAEPAGTFVDFNPTATSAGRPAVTYREARAGHDVRWTVLVDGPVRISLGCQSRPGNEEAVRAVCEQAVRSAHAIG